MVKRFDVLGIGVAAVDDLLYISAYPPSNTKVPILSTERHGGGPACTAMAAVGTLQGIAAYVACLANDELSSFIREALQTHGVDTSHILSSIHGAPYHSSILVDSFGNRNVFYDASRFQTVRAPQLSKSLIESTKILLLDHVAEPALCDIAEMARNCNIPILADVEGCSEDARYLSTLATHLIVPEEFALWATGASQLAEACSMLAGISRPTTIVTAGRAGCYCCFNSQERVVHIPAFDVDTHDTNGCGDTFHGAFALATARDFSAEESVVFASAAAALKAYADGGKRRGWDALPSLEEVLNFLSQKKQGYCNHERLLQKVASLRFIEMQ